jgi:hypothetical protein
VNIDPFTLGLWMVRITFVLLLYVFFFLLARALWRDLRSAVTETGRALGRLIVVSSPGGVPPEGASLPLDAVTSLGRDVNNSVVIDDDFASADHALLTFRGRAWYVEDRGSSNGTFLNGQRIASVAPMGFGDEVQVGRVRFRLERVSPGT